MSAVEWEDNHPSYITKYLEPYRSNKISKISIGLHKLMAYILYIKGDPVTNFL